MNKPLTAKHLTHLVEAGATIYATQWVAGLERGLAGMLEEGFVFHAHYLTSLPVATKRRMGFKA